MELLRKALGMALLSLRERTGLKQQEVARDVETTRGHLSAMESGKGDPKLSMMWRLSTVLGVSPIKLMREIVRNYRALRENERGRDL